MEIVSIENANYKYPTSEDYVLKNLSLSLEEGKVYAFIGENGGGKSTICNLIKGFIPHIYKGELEGEINIYGKNLYESKLSDFVQPIGYVSQNPFSQITGSTETVFEEIAFGLENLGVEEQEIKKKIIEVINLFGIQDLLTKNPSALSGGQKQRVAIASVYVMDPDLFILDEPTSQLDPVGTLEIFNTVSLLKSKGKTVVIVENKIELVAEYADEILLVKNGSIFDKGSPHELLSKKSTEENGAFLPQYTHLSLELKKRGYQINKIPVLENEAIEMIENIKGGY
ncbi:ABC transporter ATP-binding protein [Lentibacillus sp. N15]|uniref:energy-coupling factor ABC transporter ATP-binding protein n=1 Tax=Lentibacillus songyuanensis TaxID=3136161 RepID=UPI0031BA288A